MSAVITATSMSLISPVGVAAATGAAPVERGVSPFAAALPDATLFAGGDVGVALGRVGAGLACDAAFAGDDLGDAGLAGNVVAAGASPAGPAAVRSSIRTAAAATRATGGDGVADAGAVVDPAGPAPVALAAPAALVAPAASDELAFELVLVAWLREGCGVVDVGVDVATLCPDPTAAACAAIGAGSVERYAVKRA